jgi:hypothetical protein
MGFKKPRFNLRKWIAKKWKQLWCEHKWKTKDELKYFYVNHQLYSSSPVFRCTKCGKIK